ncbi:hypothetical protein FSP39_020466 [Pinctada imbricata]|uniref:PX domain-containing protein kinase-like protein n=1 Tax=Pinctada imbricata TaxID=66713 RepID=A0AA88YF23_PINIB|nr:hypothetical protein FSP39_020466 [Pinctada imbricata]
MAVFEKKKSDKVTLDDTIPLTCVIDAAEKRDDHMAYFLKVQRGVIPELSWLETKRYSDFATLDTELRIAGIELPLPPKKVFGNLSREFVAERQQGLQVYVNAVLGHHLLANSLAVKKFFDPLHYSINPLEQALQHVSMVFRSEKQWDVVEPLPDYGWRLRKNYILVKPVSSPKVRQLLSWVDYGPTKLMPDKELNSVLKILPAIQHPNIYPVIFATCSESGGMTIRPYHEKGTLRDVICKCKPKGHYLKKYSNPKATTALDLTAIKIMGKQILETLKFLHEKGLPYCHLHAGNVIVEDGSCRLLDLENWLLGVPSYYRAFFTQFKKINTTELIDVYSFGHLLYEMAYGQQLNAPVTESLPQNSNPQVRSVLESILMPEACKNGLPSVVDLLSHTLFSDVVLPSSEKPTLKIPSKLKEALKTAKEEMERRLIEEQKVKAMVNGEEEPKSSTTTDQSKPATEPKSSDAVPAAPPPPVAPPPPPSAPPPPAPPPSAPAPPPPPVAAPPPPSASSSGRGALLSSITGFSKTGLKKTETKDRSAPKL